MTDSSISLALNLSKIIGTALSGAFGLIGLLTDFRDPVSKQMTRWGRVALWGIIISTVVALTSQSLESAKSARDAKATTAATEAQLTKSDLILKEVDRTLNPLDDVSISYWMTVPLDDPAMVEYKQRLESGVGRIVSDYAANRLNPRFGSPARLRQNKVLAVYIPVTSSLFPTRSEMVPYYALAFSGLHLQFFLKPATTTQFEVNDPLKFPRPDLEMQVDSFDSATPNNYKLQYDLEKHTLQIVASGLPSNYESWHSDGKILSSVDLANIQVAAVIDNMMGVRADPTKSSDVNQQISRVRARMSLGAIILKVANRKFWLNMAKPMQRVERISSGYPPSTLYVAMLPPDPQLLAVQQ